MEPVNGELCYPHLLNTSCIKYPSKVFEASLVNVLLALLSTLTATLNLLVIISISHFRQLHCAANLILLSLATSDFLIGLVVIPIFTTMWKICWYFGQHMCGLVYVAPTTAMMSSVGTVVLISIDRYIAVCDPLHYPTRMTERVVGVSISICWIFGFLYAFYLYIDRIVYEEKHQVCIGECVTLPPKREANFILSFAIPVTTIVSLYVKVFIMAASQARAIRSNVTTVTSKTSRKSEIKAARNLSVVVVVYLLCYSPYYFVAYSEANTLIFGVPLQLLSIYLYFLNSCINPLIYAMLYPWFRKAIKLIVTLQILKQGSRNLKML